MGKSDKKSSGHDHENLEQVMEILDEDHLEFEEILLNLQDRTNGLSGEVKQLSEKIGESRAENLEAREMIENIEAKVDRLIALVSELRREQLD